MSMPGWYPDPGGASGTYRWWDGRTWSVQTTADPRSTPPPGAGGIPAQPGSAAGGPPDRPRRRGPAWGWILGLVGLVVVVALLGWFVLRPIATRAGGDDPGGTSTREVCPPSSEESPVLPDQGSDGRVHGGPLSYPMLGTPWSPPIPESRVAFGREVVRQQIQIEQDPDWLAGVFVGRLSAGDGFFTPEEGSKIVVECITGTFYGDAQVTRADTRNTAVTVDEHEAWLLETQLSFDIDGLEAKGEWLMVVIVAVGDGTAGLFFASVPDNAKQYIEPAKKAYAGLKVTE